MIGQVYLYTTFMNKLSRFLYRSSLGFGLSETGLITIRGFILRYCLD